MDSTLYQELLPLLIDPRKEGDVVLSYCPVHPDGAKHGRDTAGRGGRSLQLSEKRGLRCVTHSCDFKAILTELRKRAPSGPSQRKPAAQQQQRNLGEPKNVYEYRDARTGDLVACKARYEWPDPSKPKGYDKTMRWRLANGTYEQGLGGLAMAELPLFRGETAVMADPEERIWWVEGEEAVLALEAAGEIAITSGGGSGTTAFTRGQLDVLYDHDVIIWPDNDEPGRKYGRAMLENLREVCRRVVMWEPRGTAKGDDAVDFLKAKRSLAEFQWPKADSLSAMEVGSDKAVTAVRQIGFSQVIYTARDIRRERTGIHAVVTIRSRAGLLASSNFNVERDEERVRLANSAHSQLPEQIAQSYPKGELKRDLDAFCTGLWDAMSGAVDIGEMEGDPDAVAPTMVLGGYVIEGGGTILFGEPGKGKSTIAGLWATSIHTGTNRYWQVEQRPVLYVNLERAKPHMERRQARINEVLGLPPRTGMHYLNARGRTLFDVADVIQKYVRKHGIRVGILDSISRAGLGDLNENQSGNRIIDALNSLFETWVAIGHTARGDDTHVYGSQMQDAGMDIGVQLVSSRSGDGRLGVGLQVTKANDVRKPPQEVWALAYDEGGLIEMRSAQDGEFGEVEDKADRPTNEKIAIVLAAGALQVGDIAERTGLSYDLIRKTLSRHAQQFVVVDKTPKRQTWGLRAPDADDGLKCSRCGRPGGAAYSDTGQPLCESCFERKTG